jgi:hypothetical protein
MLVSAAVMATTPTVPTPAPSAPAPSSTPAASSAPASTPAVSTPAPQSTPAAAPATEQSFEQRLAAKIAPGIKQAAGEPASAVETAAAAAATETEETPAGEAATLETDPPAEAAQVEEQPGEGEENAFDFDAHEPLGPKALSEKIAANPELKAMIDANPEFRDQIYADSRLAAKAKQYGEMFGSPEEAKVVAESHQTFANLRSLMGSVKPGDMQSTQGVINAMLEQGALRDENGEVLRDAKGQMVTDGTVGRFLKNFFEMRLNLFEQQAKQQGDNETLAALDTIMERAGLRTPSSVDEDGMSEELKAERARIASERQELDQRRDQEQKAAQTRHDTAVFSKIDSNLDKSIGTILERATGLTDFTRSTVEGQLRSALQKAVQSNPSYQTELDRIERMPIGPNREQKHVALATRYVQDHLLRVAAPILQKAGVTLQKAAAAKQQTQAARAEAARSEIRGSAAPAHLQKPQDRAAQNAQIKEQLRQKLGREPQLEEVLAAKIQARSRTVAA